MLAMVEGRGQLASQVLQPQFLQPVSQLCQSCQMQGNGVTPLPVWSQVNASLGYIQCFGAFTSFTLNHFLQFFIYNYYAGGGGQVKWLPAQMLMCQGHVKRGQTDSEWRNWIFHCIVKRPNSYWSTVFCEDSAEGLSLCKSDQCTLQTSHTRCTLHGTFSKTLIKLMVQCQGNSG